jgi:hypothetical protein
MNNSFTPNIKRNKEIIQGRSFLSTNEVKYFIIISELAIRD